MEQKITQISVFLENKSGRLFEVTRILGENDIDIKAMSIADTTDFGILRLIVNKPQKARNILKEEGFTVNATGVLAISIPDKPEGLAGALKIMKDNDIEIEYVYNFISKLNKKASVILRVTDCERAVCLFEDNDIKVLGADSFSEF